MLLILANLTISGEAATFLGIGLVALLSVTGYGLVQIHSNSATTSVKIEEKLDRVLDKMGELERDLSSSRTLAETAQTEVKRLRRSINTLFDGFHEMDKLIAVRMGTANTGLKMPKLEILDDET